MELLKARRANSHHETVDISRCDAENATSGDLHFLSNFMALFILLRSR